MSDVPLFPLAGRSYRTRRTDQDVLGAVAELNKMRCRYSYDDIAAYLGCHPNTVAAAIKRLMADGLIIRTATRAQNSCYQIVTNSEEAWHER